VRATTVDVDTEHRPPTLARHADPAVSLVRWDESVASQADGEFGVLVLGQDETGHGKNVAFGQSSRYGNENIIIAADMYDYWYVGQANYSHGAPYLGWSQPA
jgi:hypothetical protein